MSVAFLFKPYSRVLFAYSLPAKTSVRSIPHQPRKYRVAGFYFYTGKEEISCWRKSFKPDPFRNYLPSALSKADGYRKSLFTMIVPWAH